MPDASLLRNILHFVRLLRDLGLPVDPHRALLFGEALEHVPLARREDVYHSARSCLIYRQEDLAEFDRAFELFWRRRLQGGIPLSLPQPGRQPAREPGPAKGRSSGTDPEPAAGVGRLAYSPSESLRQKDFAELSRDELEAVARMMRGMIWRLGEHPGRRQRAGAGQLPDHRRTLRASLRYGGEPLVWALRGRRPKLRRLVLLADVSGSMQPYARTLLEFLYGLSRGLERPPEIFAFGTRLTRITRPLRLRHAEQALQEVYREVLDWSGGTRIGEALRQFNLHWARRVLSGAAIVAIISDGLDRGQTARLRSEVARLQRSCWRLIWVNPLSGSPDYEPLAQGMRAALPFLDDFLPADNLANLETVALRLQAAAAESRPRRRAVPVRPSPQSGREQVA